MAVRSSCRPSTLPSPPQGVAADSTYDGAAPIECKSTVSRWKRDVVMKIDDSQRAERPDPALSDSQTYDQRFEGNYHEQFNRKRTKRSLNYWRKQGHWI